MATVSRRGRATHDATTQSRRVVLRTPQYQLTDRDLQILRWITRHGVVTPELVGRRFFWRSERATYGQWAAYRRLRVLRELGLIRTDKPYAHHPELIRATKDGARLADVGVGPASLVLSELRHTLAVVALAESLLDARPGATLITDRELWVERYRQRFLEGNISNLGRVPDAVLVIPGANGQRPTAIAVELDLSRKSRPTVQTMVQRYDPVPVDAVWLYVTPGRVEHVRAWLTELRAGDRFQVLGWQG